MYRPLERFRMHVGVSQIEFCSIFDYACNPIIFILLVPLGAEKEGFDRLIIKDAWTKTNA